jgi:hypothetical protein
LTAAQEIPVKTRIHTKPLVPPSFETGTKNTFITPPPPPSRRVLAVMMTGGGGDDEDDNADDNAKKAIADTSVTCALQSARARTFNLPSLIKLLLLLLLLMVKTVT